MITKLPFILALFSVGCISLLSQDSFAQDGLPLQNFQEPSYLELNLNEDKPLLFEPNENRSLRTTTQNMQRDSVVHSSSKPKSIKKPVEDKKEDDALSFNFLYYIIQKYKISDIVDQ